MRPWWQQLEALVVAMLAVVGLLFASTVVAVAVAGILQWRGLGSRVDGVLPVLVLALGLVLAGRVAADVAGRAAVPCVVLAASLVALVGTVISRAGEAHGDAIDGWQIGVASSCVLVLTGGTAWWVQHRRRRHRRL